ncbi:uncharacterized protein AKAME5_001945500 [Lates japonicus]|uniref:Uncharacterized protein n=1 Tax=Lates japonicus TaxID=270547 RepID=A0AAD3N930_LATJO|nr:uncharacterized protein AKAME5_001945500 [Lates japonicus]
MGNCMPGFTYAPAPTVSPHVEPAEEPAVEPAEEPAVEPADTSADTQREAGNPTVIAQRGGVVSSPHVSGVNCGGNINLTVIVNKFFCFGCTG